MDSGSSYGYGQSSYDSYTARITFPVSVCGPSPETRQRWLKRVLIILAMFNMVLLLGFTVLDMVKVIEHRNMSEEFAPNIINDTKDFPAIMITDLRIELMNPSFTFNILVFVTICFVPVLLMYGVFTERKYEICISLVITFILICFLIPDIMFRNAWQLWYKKTRIFVTFGLALICIPINCRLVSEVDWLEFRVAGTSAGMMDLYRRLRYFNSLLHLDFYCVCLLAIMNISSGIASSAADYAIVVAIASYGAICLVIGSIGVNREKKEMVFTFAALSTLLLVWIPIQIRINSCLVGSVSSNCNESQHLLAYTAVSAGILAILIKIYLTVELLKVYRAFGYGLTDSAFIGLIVGEASSLLVGR